MLEEAGHLMEALSVMPAAVAAVVSGHTNSSASPQQGEFMRGSEAYAAHATTVHMGWQSSPHVVVGGD